MYFINIILKGFNKIISGLFTKFDEEYIKKQYSFLNNEFNDLLDYESKTFVNCLINDITVEFKKIIIEKKILEGLNKLDNLINKSKIYKENEGFLYIFLI